MIYPFWCSKCQLEWDVIKEAAKHRDPESCPSCTLPMERVFTPAQFYGAKNEWPEYNPAFGKVIRNKEHRKNEAKEAGMVEIGNESLQTIHSHFDKMRENDHKERYNKIQRELGIPED